jgi:hypothetical protein
MNFPDQSLRHHEERESGPAKEASSPHVIGSVKSGKNLIEIVGCSHLHLPVIVLENVITVFEFGVISLSLMLGETSSGVDASIVIEVVIVKTLRGSESLVVEAGVSR